MVHSRTGIAGHLALSNFPCSGATISVLLDISVCHHHQTDLNGAASVSSNPSVLQSVTPPVSMPKSTPVFVRSRNCASCVRRPWCELPRSSLLRATAPRRKFVTSAAQCASAQTRWATPRANLDLLHALCISCCFVLLRAFRALRLPFP